ncbi:MAG: hypothetical protein Q8P64_17100 [Deltaproteobacteria bacterium]|nr:hypothetical protein [Deltaproteobacteria bacterium]
MKKTSYFLTLLALVVLIVPSLVWSEAKPNGSSPVITNSFAVEKGYYGYIWKIYIEAEDPDGDMSRIAVQVDQLGYGYYPADWTIIKAPNRKHLKGYLQWNTFSNRTSYLREWTNITLRLSVFDKAGNESKEVVFPFEFVSGAKGQYQYKLPTPFDSGDIQRLGYIHIDLFEPTLMGGDGQRDK